MEEFHVDIKFPGRDAEDTNLVVISGREEDVSDCREHLLNLEEEYVSCLARQNGPTSIISLWLRLLSSWLVKSTFKWQNVLGLLLSLNSPVSDKHLHKVMRHFLGYFCQ